LNHDDAALKIPGGVQLFLILGSGETVSVCPKPTSLYLVIPKEKSVPPRCYIHIANWKCQLQHGITPMMKCLNELYVFPIPEGTEVSANCRQIGIVLSSGLPPLFRKTFEELLQYYTIFKVEQNSDVPISIYNKLMTSEQFQEERPVGEQVINLSKTVRYNEAYDDSERGLVAQPSTAGEAISQKIDRGVEAVSSGMAIGAQTASNFIQSGSQSLQKHLRPSETPKGVNANVERGLEIANKFTSVAVKATGMVVAGISTVGTEATRVATPHLKNAAKSVTKTVSEEKGNRIVDDVFLVAGASFRGIGRIWESLECAGSLVANTASQATQETVEHKYGHDAGQAVGLVTGTALNIGKTVTNFNNVGIKALAKKVGKECGKTFLEGYVENREPLPE